MTKQEYSELLSFLLKTNDHPRVMANETKDGYQLRLNNEQKDYWFIVTIPKSEISNLMEKE